MHYISVLHYCLYSNKTEIIFFIKSLEFKHSIQSISAIISCYAYNNMMRNLVHKYHDNDITHEYKLFLNCITTYFVNKFCIFVNFAWDSHAAAYVFSMPVFSVSFSSEEITWAFFSLSLKPEFFSSGVFVLANFLGDPFLDFPGLVFFVNWKK